MRDCWRFGFQQVTSTKTIAVMSIWLGYQLSPWAAVLNEGTWSNILLVRENIDSALLFSSLSMAAFILGFRFGGESKRASGQPARDKGYSVNIPARWLVICSVTSVVFLCLMLGGPDEAWKSNARRGEGQFEVHDAAAKVRHLYTIASGMADLALAALAIMYILGRKPNAARYAVAAACLLVASLRNMGHFSRASGEAFILTAFFLLRLRGKRGVVPAVVCLTVAWWLGSIGLNGRNNYPPGVGWFVTAAVEDVTEERGELPQRSLAESNPVDSISAWTRRAATRASDSSSTALLIRDFLWDLHPLPSEYFGLEPIGENLAVVMHTVRSSTGLPTPALGELFYCFGYYGAFGLLIIGAIFRWFEDEDNKGKGWIGGIGIALCLVALAYGAHSSVRAMTRPLLYGLIINRIAFTLTRKQRVIHAVRYRPAGQPAT